MKILIKALMPSFGDLILATGPLRLLKEQRNNPKIFLLTKFPEILQGNPFIACVFTRESEAFSFCYDEIIDLSMVNFADEENITFNYAHLLDIKWRNPWELAPQIFLYKEEIMWAKSLVAKQVPIGKKICVVHPSTHKFYWEGRNWSLEGFKVIIERLQNLGYFVIEIGKRIRSTKISDLSLIDQTSLRELASIISLSDLFVGIDSGPFHLAQAFKIKSIVIFGPTEPYSRIIDFKFSSFIRNESLTCIGCYNRKGVSNLNKCERGTIECMKQLNPTYVADEIERMLKNPLYFANKNIAYLQQLLQNKNKKLQKESYYMKYTNIHKEYLRYRKGYYAFFRWLYAIRQKIITINHFFHKNFFKFRAKNKKP